MQLLNLVHTTHFWNNLHQPRSKSKAKKPNNSNLFGSKKTKRP